MGENSGKTGWLKRYQKEDIIMENNMEYIWKKTASGWSLEKRAGLGDAAKEIFEMGKDMLIGRSKTFRASTLDPYMPKLLLDTLEWIGPMLYKVNVTVRKFVPGSPDESDYSITVVEASSPEPRWMSPSPHTVSLRDVGKLDNQLQYWISKNKKYVHGIISGLIKKETGGDAEEFRSWKK